MDVGESDKLRKWEEQKKRNESRNEGGVRKRRRDKGKKK